MSCFGLAAPPWQFVEVDVSAARFGGQSQKNILIAKGKKAVVSAPPPCSIPCLSNLVQFQKLLLQLLKSFTKQMWLFLFYLHYACGCFNTVIRGEEEAPEPHQVRAVLCRRVALPCACHNPVVTPVTLICLSEAAFTCSGSIFGADGAVLNPCPSRSCPLPQGDPLVSVFQ